MAVLQQWCRCASPVSAVRYIDDQASLAPAVTAAIATFCEHRYHLNGEVLQHRRLRRWKILITPTGNHREYLRWLLIGSGRPR